MKALRFDQYGGIDVLKFDQDVPVPTPGAGEVLVRVSGSGVNPVDWKIREGLMAHAFPTTFPATVAVEFSGTIEALGEGVTRFNVGDEVYGQSRRGTCAEYTVANVAAVELKPVSMDLPDAAAIPVAAMTAWQALIDIADIQNGQKVLIHAAAGGVGTMAVQIAKWKGAYVYATASARNHHLLQELGADEAIDYTTTRFEDVAKDVDMVLEAVGGEQTLRSLECLKPGGILVSITSPPPVDVAQAAGKRAAFLAMDNSKPGQLAEISALIQDLKLRPVIDTVVPFHEAIEAQKESQAGHVRGKIVVDVRR